MTTWIPVIVAVTSALLAGWFAMRAREVGASGAALTRNRAPRREFEESEAFEPLVAAIAEFWERAGKDEASPEWIEEHLMPRFQEYMRWVAIYGSDDAVWTVHRYMQAIHADAPSGITMRLLAELTLSLRRELGQPETKVTALDVYGLQGQRHLRSRCCVAVGTALRAGVVHPTWLESSLGKTVPLRNAAQALACRWALS